MRHAKLVLAAIVIAGGPVAIAAEIEGVSFAPKHLVDQTELRLNGTGLMRHRVVFKAFVAGLYLEAGAEPTKSLADVPKRLEIHYFWSIAGKDFAKAADAVLADAFDEETLAALKPRIAKMNSLYKDVRPGDRYSLTYLPGRGTRLELNGKTLGMVEGSDFAAVYFAIWLGERPMSEAFRDQLLNYRR